VRRSWIRVAAAGLAICCGAATPAFAQAPTQPAPRIVPRIAIDDAAGASALTVLDAAGSLPFPVAVRIDGRAVPELDATLTALEQRGIPIWLTLPAPDRAEDLDAWQARVRAVAAQHGRGLTVLEIDVDRQPPAVARFAAQAAAVDAGAGSDGTRIALGGAAMRDPLQRAAIYTADVAPYVDLLAIDTAGADAAATWLRTIDPQASVAVMPGPSDPPREHAFLEGTFEAIASRIAIRAWRPADVRAAALRGLGGLGGLLTHEIALVDDAGAHLTMTRDGTDVSASIRHVLLFDTETFATYLAYWTDVPGDALTVGLSIPVAGVPRLHDPLSGQRTSLPGGGRDRAATTDDLRLPVPGHPMVVDFNDGATPLAERSEVSAERSLSVGEIIARHQRQQRAQDAVVDHYIAHARMEQHFRPTMADPGYDVVAENTFFSGRDGVEWEELSFAVNGSKWGADRPPFPLLQPEKVLSLPLRLEFDASYTYRLTGTERVDGIDCYAVRFEPVREDSALYRGTVWIDRQTFARIRVHAVQSGLPSPVISNDETQEYTRVATIGRQPIFLFSGLTARQILLVAGRNLLVEKRVTFSDFHVNGPDFDGRRAEARAGGAIMFRETAQGLRYYVKQDGRRVVSDSPTRDLKALAMGVTLDPSYGFPLPIFGINYLNFHAGSPDTQLAVLFAGVLIAGNVQRSHVGAKSVDASLDFFAIAAPSSDRIYGPQGEDPGARVLTWPLSTGFNLGWQMTPYQKLTFQDQFRFDGYVRDRTTTDDFIVPSSTITNGIGGAWEYRRAGYSVVSNAAWFRRASWRTWGYGTRSSPRYVKYSAALSRDVYLNPFQKLHFNGSWFGSSDADRFGQYQFGMFDDTRIHGVPASGVRFGELAMVRGTYSVNIFEQYRLDLFLEHAWGRDRPGHGAWQTIPAVGIAINVRAPWDTILRVDAGKAVLPDRYSRLGSATLQVMLLKPLK
jgi:hypothetical protein